MSLSSFSVVKWCVVLISDLDQVCETEFCYFLS